MARVWKYYEESKEYVESMEIVGESMARVCR